MVLRLLFAGVSILVATAVLGTAISMIEILKLLQPYISVLLGIFVGALGRFIWHNHVRSKQNSTRLDRYGRTLFGDEEDEADHGLTIQLNNLAEQVDKVEEQLSELNTKLDLLMDS